MSTELDYSQVLIELGKADADFTAANGFAPLEQWDAMLEAAVVAYNAKHGTNFDPKEGRWQYIEQQEEICDRLDNFKVMDVSVDEIAVGQFDKPKIH